MLLLPLLMCVGVFLFFCMSGVFADFLTPVHTSPTHTYTHRLTSSAETQERENVRLKARYEAELKMAQQAAVANNGRRSGSTSASSDGGSKRGGGDIDNKSGSGSGGEEDNEEENGDVVDV